MKKELYNSILKFVSKKHENQIRKNGEPYINHLIRVCKNVEDSGYDQMHQAVALLHDVLEDTDTTEEELNKLYDMEAVDCIKVLTRTTSNEKEYINSILDFKMAIVVKSADIIDNMLSAGVLARDPRYRDWAINYIRKAEIYYKGKFCKAVDEAITLSKELENNNVKFEDAIKKIGKIIVE